MAQRIPEQVINEIRDSLDIVDVVSDYVSLKKQGKHYSGLCPFHNEKTPSFTVSSDKQLYHCFGCGAGGNAITFVMEKDNLPFVEAVEKLAGKANIALPEQPGAAYQKQEEASPLWEAHELAARYYHHLLMNTEQGKEAYDYLLNRGVTVEQMETFRLGYAPNQPRMLKELLEKREFDIEEMVEGGLLFRRESSWDIYDRFRHRIMFPIHNAKGKVKAFGGRSLGEQEPKYLNSPETSIFLKHESLYGIHLARGPIRKKNQAVLFEGYADVIAASGAGVTNGIAALGTALSERQVQWIRRNTDQVLLCYDGDEAGQKAAWKAGALFEKEKVNVQVALLPDKVDPDDYIRKHGSEKFKKDILNSSVSITSFKMKYLRKNKNLNNEGDKLAYVETVIKEIVKLPGAVEQDIYLRQLAEEFSLSLDALNEEKERLARTRQEPVRPPSSYMEEPPPPPVQETSSYRKNQLLPAYMNAEKQLLAHMLQNKNTAFRVQEVLGGEFNFDAHMAVAAHLYAFYADGNEPDPGEFLSYLEDGELRNIVSEISLLDIQADLSENEMSDYVYQIKRYPERVLVKEKERKIKEAEHRKDYETALKLAMELLELRKSSGL